MAKELTSANINLAKEGVALVDFWAPWCGPCRMLAPAIDELSNEFEGKALVAKVNIDDCEELAAEFGIRSVPTMLFFKNGEIVDTVIGAQAKQALADKLNALL